MRYLPRKDEFFFLEIAPMISNLQQNGQQLSVTWSDGTTADLHYRWLRDNCQSPTSMHASGQKLLETTEIPAAIRPTTVNLTDGGDLVIHWPGDQHGYEHISEFSSEWLRANYNGSPQPDICQEQLTLWDNHQAPVEFAFQYDDVVADYQTQRAWLEAFVEYGVTLLHGVPTRPSMVNEVAEIFGYVRETNYGRLFDVKSVINPNNLAYTGLALSPHTDNPYRDPVPTIQLLHCLDADVSGGDSTVVDGFAIANKLKQSSPDAFNRLATTPVQFRFQDETTDLCSQKTIIGLDVSGAVKAIHLNNRSIQPFQLPSSEMGAFYDAYTTFAQMVNDPQNQIVFKLSPGDLFMVNNRRVLHGRTGYASNGSRHLQGCYADVDSLSSRLAVLQRT